MYRGSCSSSPDGNEIEALFVVEVSKYSNSETDFQGICECCNNEVEEDGPKDDVVCAPTRLLVALESSLVEIPRDKCVDR